jgi:hypothetical protein
MPSPASSDINEQSLAGRKDPMSSTITATESTITATEKTPTRTLVPALDGEIYTIDELIRRRASELRGLPLIGYPNEGVTDYEDHSAFAVNKYADAAAEALQRRGLHKVVSNKMPRRNVT